MDIVVGFIRSAEGRAALNRGIEEARLRGAHLIIVHSSKGVRSTESFPLIGGSEEREEIADSIELDQISKKLAAAGVDHEIQHRVMGHSPAEDVVGVANETGSNLIVIGLRRRSPVGKLILGSNAQDILLQADCAVLAVKPGPRSEGTSTFF